MNEDGRTIDTIYSDERVVYQKLDETEAQLSDLVRYEETLLSSYGSALSYAKHLLNTSSTSSALTFYEELVRQMEGTHYQIEETLIEQKKFFTKSTGLFRRETRCSPAGESIYFSKRRNSTRKGEKRWSK